MPKMRQARRPGGTRMWSLLMPPPQRATSIVCAITSVSITRALLLSLTAALSTRASCCKSPCFASKCVAHRPVSYMSDKSNTPFRQHAAQAPPRRSVRDA